MTEGKIWNMHYQGLGDFSRFSNLTAVFKDTIEACKIVNGLNGIRPKILHHDYLSSRTRDNIKKPIKHRPLLAARATFFSDRAVNGWNRLSWTAVETPSRTVSWDMKCVSMCGDADVSSDITGSFVLPRSNRSLAAGLRCVSRSPPPTSSRNGVAGTPRTAQGR